MSGIIDISVIVPVYNVEKYVKKCLISLLEQTHENIEIICIDDCSTDKSLQIIEDIAATDNRIKIYKNKKNSGRLYTRKVGVKHALGRYIMFCDSDDFYNEKTCEIALRAIEQNKTDIVQFGMNVINAGNASQYECDSFEKFVAPYEGKLEGREVLEACFLEEKYNYNLVNKVYSEKLCKKAFSVVDDKYYCMAEDMLVYFCFAYFAKSYYGIADKLYNYNFAIGISKPGALDLEGLNSRCAGAESVNAIKDFLDKENEFNQYKNIYTKIERRILSDNFDAWYYRLPHQFREQGYDIFEKHWGRDKVMLSFFYDIENKQYDINNKRCEIENKQHEINNLTAHISELQAVQEKNIFMKKQNEELQKMLDEKEEYERKYNDLLNSVSWKVGRIITWLPRKIKNINMNQ